MSPTTNHSTGPRTAAGIENCKYNAIKHGLTGKQIVIKGEDPEAYDTLRTSLIAQYQPANEEEAMLVERIAQTWWKLQRAERHEQYIANADNSAIALYQRTAWASFYRHRTSVERAWNRARKELAELQGARKKAEAAAAASIRIEPKPQPRPVDQSVLTIPARPKYTDAELALRL